jgi:hypothetical protein
MGTPCSSSISAGKDVEVGEEVGSDVASSVAVDEGSGEGASVSVTAGVGDNCAGWVSVGCVVGGCEGGMSCGTEVVGALQAESIKVRTATMNVSNPC